MRYHVVAQLKERGDPWRLNEEVKAALPPTKLGSFLACISV
jgi:hypothetical protein